MIREHGITERRSAMQDSSYNGWTNYETWAVGMFLDGNYTGEGTYREVLALVHDVVEYNGALSPSEITYRLGEDLKDWFDQQLPEISGIAQDLLGAACSEVNWRELAEAKLAEISDEN
jgi:hypothetical protein